MGSASAGDEMTAVNYDELRDLSAGLLSQAETMSAEIDALVTEVQVLRDSWTGEAQEAFSLAFGYAQGDAENLADWLTRASASIATVRDTYMAADETVVSAS